MRGFEKPLNILRSSGRVHAESQGVTGTYFDRIVMRLVTSMVHARTKHDNGWTRITRRSHPR